MTARLCTQRQLDEMCRSGVERVHEALDSGDLEAGRETIRFVLEARAGFVEVFGRWFGTTLNWIGREHGEDAISGALDAEEWLGLGLMSGATPEEVALARRIRARPAEAAEEIVGLAATGELAAAKEAWAEIERAGLKIHDYRRDWVTALLSHLYRSYGVDALNEALLYAAGREWWTSWIDSEVDAAPVERVQAWATHMTIANFGSISITEEDERFVIHHKVCGSCGRQELQGRYEPPCSFPRIAEPRPDVIFGHADDTIYRAHLPTLHHVATIKRRGFPWPSIECTGVPGRCWFFLYKNPAETPEEYFASVGLKRPADL